MVGTVRNFNQVLKNKIRATSNKKKFIKLAKELELTPEQLELIQQYLVQDYIRPVLYEKIKEHQAMFCIMKKNYKECTNSICTTTKLREYEIELVSLQANYEATFEIQSRVVRAYKKL